MTYKNGISRRIFLEGAFGAIASGVFPHFFLPPSFGSEANSGIAAGAIRWDAWYKKESPSTQAQYSLSSDKYFKRAPFFCSVSAGPQVQCIGTASQMGQEIDFAARGGLKYWAFDWYEASSSLRVGWNLYRASKNRALLNWCGIVGLANLGSVPFSNDKWRANIDEWAGYMREGSYQKVDVGGVSRPLLYLLWDEGQVGTFFGGDNGNIRLFFNNLKERLASFSVGAPYVVLLDGAPGAKIAAEIGADAISNYISGFSRETRGSYRDLDRQTQEFWGKLAATNLPIVPIAMVGWDTRPRQERPVSWEHKTATSNPTTYYQLPTPGELAGHVRSAVEYINGHSRSCPSRTLLIYSWDECDEGGGLIPTLGDPGGSYLAAIAPIIR